MITAYAVSIFFALRVAGRFIGAWVLARWNWTTVLAIFCGAILACFLGAMVGSPDVRAYLLALSGLFMSVIYPTLNSKGISCFPKSDHGAAAGVILFFTCAGAILGPLSMGVVSDIFGSMHAGFVLATFFAGLLFIGLLYNAIANPIGDALQRSDATEYGICTEADLADKS